MSATRLRGKSRLHAQPFPALRKREQPCVPTPFAKTGSSSHSLTHPKTARPTRTSPSAAPFQTSLSFRHSTGLTCLPSNARLHLRHGEQRHQDSKPHTGVQTLKSLRKQTHVYSDMIWPLFWMDVSLLRQGGWRNENQRMSNQRRNSLIRHGDEYTSLFNP
ncbi:hypothetical protein EX30DRAFT_117461 [Ascodesmis nigricans]|uniref:Uncharacterized protein n=1 Tax=Ascodesmis nigricans TaxID=341454 RepID=A0A4S2MPM3_9PEZI|nr:hypothetical protein EX30DRAFT_117461 [Ascodesmis nigricans]